MRRLAAPLVLALVVAACGGPQPKVTSARAGEVQDGKSVVTVELRNDGGKGSVELTVTLRDDDGTVVGRKTTSVDLEDDERIRVAVEVPVAAGTTRVNAEAEAKYPPE